MRVLLLVVLTLATMPALAESWICIAEKATGFTFDKQKKVWDYARFNTGETKYLIRPPTEKDLEGVDKAVAGIPNPAFVVVEIGQSAPRYYCAGFNAAGILLCSGLDADFAFGKKRLRFSSYSPWLGYIAFDPPGSDSLTVEGTQDVFVQIGSCSPI